MIFTDKALLQKQIEDNLPFDKLESFKQIKYVMLILKSYDHCNYDVHVLSKALSILGRFHSGTWKQTKLLFFSGILEEIKKIMAFG